LHQHQLKLCQIWFTVLVTGTLFVTLIVSSIPLAQALPIRTYRLIIVPKFNQHKMLTVHRYRTVPDSLLPVYWTTVCKWGSRSQQDSIYEKSRL